MLCNCNRSFLPDIYQDIADIAAASFTDIKGTHCAMLAPATRSSLLEASVLSMIPPVIFNFPAAIRMA